MAVEIAIIKDTTPTSDGIKDFTSAGFGTAQASIVLFTRATATSNPRNHATFSIGFIDGSRQNYNSYFGNGTGTVTRRSSGIDACLYDWFDGSGVIVRAVFTSWISDGVRLNFTDTANNAFYITIILFKGLTNFRADTELLSITGVNDITSPNFKPDLVFFSTTGQSSHTNAGPEAKISFGVAHNSSSDIVSQGQVCMRSQQIQAANTDAAVFDNSCVGELELNGITWTGAAQDFDASGFSIDTGASVSGDYIYYLAMKLDNPNDADVRIIDTPTVLGTESYSVGFQPSLVFIGQSYVDVLNTDVKSLMGYGVGVADASDQIYHGFCDPHNGFSRRRSNVGTSQISQLYIDEDNNPINATLSAFTASGYDLNYTTVDATARKWLSVAIGASAVSGQGPSALMFGANF